MKKEKLLCLGLTLFFNYFPCNAEITLVSKNDQQLAEVEKPAKPTEPEKSRSLPTRPKKKISRPNSPITQLHIDGYINKNYVRLVVDIEKNNMLTGYIFEKSNVKTYVYGQKVNGALHMYDENGRHFTVIIDTK